MRLTVGEKVVFLREVGGGTVTKIEGRTVYVEDETGFDRPFRPEDLGKVHGTNYRVPEDEITLLKLSDGIDFSQQHQSRIYSSHKDHWEIDLHFEDLIDVYGEKLSHSQEQALLKQLAVFKDFYYKARKKKIRKLIVIHGFGKGILREELHVFLKGQDGVDFFDAPYIEYGHGATQVEIKYNY